MNVPLRFLIFKSSVIHLGQAVRRAISALIFFTSGFCVSLAFAHGGEAAPSALMHTHSAPGAGEVESPVESDPNPEDESWQVDHPEYSVAAETVAIDVQTGTWMNLDVSPAGDQIVFDLLGDLYLLPIGGGEATRITQGHAWDMQPRFSPEGNRVAFTSDRSGGDNIWVLSLGDEEPKQITKESFRLMNNPAWHPDGQRLVAKKHFTTSRSLGTGEIWMFDLASEGASQGVQLVERQSPSYQKELGEPAFSPDGSQLYYTHNTSPGGSFVYHEDSHSELFEIRALSLTDGETESVAGGYGGAVRASPSPSGDFLAYVKRVRASSRLFVKNLATDTDVMLVEDLDPDMQETWGVYGLYPNFAWLPNDAGLVYWAKGRLWQVAFPSGDIREIPFHIKDERVIYSAPRPAVAVGADTFDTAMVRFAQTAPDGEHVVFESLGKLWIQSTGGAPKPLTNHQDARHEYSPVWAPDGRELYFFSWTDLEGTQLHRISRKGRAEKSLPLPQGHYVNLSVSPSGEALLFRKLSGDDLTHPDWGKSPGLYRLDLVDSKAVRLVDEGAAPSEGLDGRVYYTHRSWGEKGAAATVLKSVSLAGDDERTHAKSELARSMHLSPDGRYLAFVENYQLHLTRVPALGVAFDVGPKMQALPVVQLSENGADYVSFSSDSRRIHWSLGAEHFSYALANFPENTAVSSVSLSQTMTADKPVQRLALIGARAVTMDAARQVIENAVILIRDNRIEAIGSAAELSVPEGAVEVDLRGMTVVPGFIDAHAHGPYGRDEIIPQSNWSLLAHLALGVTTVHNPSSRANQVFAAGEYQRAGRILGPRIYSTGEVVYGAKSVGFADINSLDDALSHIRRLKAQGAISIKNYNQPRREQRQQVIEAARLENLLVVAEGGSLYHMDMNLVADGSSGIEHNIPTLAVYEDVTQFWRASQAAYTPTLVVTYGGLTSEDYYYQQTDVWKHPLLAQFVPPDLLQARSVRRVMAPDSDFRDDDAAFVAKQLLEEGVMVNSGAHGQREGLATHWEMWSFARGGMSPMQALSTATINPAQHLGMAADLGSLEANKLADLVILRRNPLEGIQATDEIHMVMMNGRLYGAPTLAEQVTGNRAAPQLWWHGKAQFEIR